VLGVAVEIAHWSAVVPLAFVAAFRRGALAAFWLVAMGFVVSFVADTIAMALGGSWVLVPWYLIAQYTLFAAAMFTEGARQVLPSVLVYVLVGGAIYLGMVQHRPLVAGQPTPEEYDAFMRWWLPYQGVRLASFGLFVRAAWRTA
jgi:hypothetical protein